MALTVDQMAATSQTGRRRSSRSVNLRFLFGSSWYSWRFRRVAAGAYLVGLIVCVATWAIRVFSPTQLHIHKRVLYSIWAGGTIVWLLGLCLLLAAWVYRPFFSNK